MTRTAVLGAGALGLTVAYRLARRGDEVVVLEREALPGGLAAGFEIEPGIWLDRFYHHLFASDRHAIGLINELGLGGKLLWRRPLTVTLRDDKVHQLSERVGHETGALSVNLRRCAPMASTWLRFLDRLSDFVRQRFQLLDTVAGWPIHVLRR